MTTILLSKKTLIISFISLIISFMVMLTFDGYLKNEVAPNGIVSFELAQDLDQSKAIINSWNEQSKTAAGLSLGFDYLYMFIYGGFISLLLLRVKNHFQQKPFLRKTARLALMGVWVAVLFDAIENYALIRLILGDVREVWPSLAFYFASAKFIILLMAVVFFLIALPIVIFGRRGKQ
ncbi:MAG: hypothetical protein ABJG41_00275 [Cyclobacteriaceae bacterium]